MKIGLLHPGAMGVSVGAAARAAGHEVLWLPAGRSAATRQRAQSQSFTACADLRALTDQAQVVISVCPPHGALALARQVVGADFAGIYVDANAVAPATARAIADLVGCRFVDGGIIGPPATQAGTTRLYLSGQEAEQVQALFSRGLLQAISMEGGPGAASALKMCYAAYTKGLSAMLLGVRALAAAEGVDQALINEWQISQQGLTERSELTARATAPKAWRFVGEMQEIAASFAANDLPDGFYRAAAELYGRMSGFKDAAAPVAIADVLRALRDQSETD